MSRPLMNCTAGSLLPIQGCFSHANHEFYLTRVNECKVSCIHKKKKHSPFCIHIDTHLEALLAFGSAVKLKENEYQYRTEVNTSHAKASHTGDQWTK